MDSRDADTAGMEQVKKSNQKLKESASEYEEDVKKLGEYIVSL